MLQLPGNCRAGAFSVTPANWKSQSAKVKSIWKISYWFFDDTLKKKKQIVIKGCNRLNTLKEKQDFIRTFIDYETDLLSQQGYNPITGQYTLKEEAEVTGRTLMLPALDYAFDKLDIEDKSDIKSALSYIKKAIRLLRYDRLQIGEINLMHISTILEKASVGKSASTYNHYRSYLSMLYRPLLLIYAVTSNPVRDTFQKKVTRKIRKELSKKERELVRNFLSQAYPHFWRFVNIFFHCGARETEMLNIRKEDIDLKNQRFKVLVKKGKTPREEWRPIKNLVLRDWQLLYLGAREGEYIFSVGLIPGPKKIRVEQLVRRWRMHVKEKLGIKADFYSLKHSNLDEISEALSVHEKAIKTTSVAAGHTTPVITMDVYTQGEKERRNKTIREVANEF